jgi:hypothetical protein
VFRVDLEGANEADDTHKAVPAEAHRHQRNLLHPAQIRISMSSEYGTRKTVTAGFGPRRSGEGP